MPLGVKHSTCASCVSFVRCADSDDMSSRVAEQCRDFRDCAADEADDNHQLDYQRDEGEKREGFRNMNTPPWER
jgi:hypothetical protein